MYKLNESTHFQGSWLWQQVAFRYKIESARVFLTLVVTVSLLLSFNVIHTASIRDSIETGNLKPAEDIALFLKDNLQNTDVVLYDSPSEYSLKYYFRQHNIPETYLTYDSNAGAQRVLVVVNQLHGYTLERVLDENGFSGSIAFDSAQIMQRYDSAILYQIDSIE